MVTADETICVRYFAAAELLRRGEVDEAARELESLTLEAASFAPAWDGLGGCWEARGDLRRAGECYREAIRRDPGNWRSRYNWGVALHRAGDLDQASRWLRDAARRAPQRREILHRLGLCHFDQGDFDRAIRCYRLALEQPEKEVLDAELFARIGDAECEREEHQAADEAYQRACLLNPEAPELYYQWAVLSARQGDLFGAERLARRAQALDGRSSRPQALLVELALEAGAWPAAEARIADLALAPGQQRLAEALGAELAFRQGKAVEAKRRAVETLRRDGPPSDQAVDLALDLLRRLRGRDTATRGFRIVLEVDCGAEVYYRPYVVTAETETEARCCVADLQDALDSSPWRVAEVESFHHPGESSAVGVHQVLLTRVLFAREQAWR
jgi:tetratricopeptide (TPR) repeat protein